LLRRGDDPLSGAAGKVRWCSRDGCCQRFPRSRVLELILKPAGTNKIWRIKMSISPDQAIMSASFVCHKHSAPVRYYSFSASSSSVELFRSRSAGLMRHSDERWWVFDRRCHLFRFVCGLTGCVRRPRQSGREFCYSPVDSGSH
jgi:hypothetical protein